MTNLFKTISEANDLITVCVRCSKSKFSIKPNVIEGKILYSLLKCTTLTCEAHCHGHDAVIEIDPASDGRSSVVAFFV